MMILRGSQPEVTTFYRDCTYYVTPTVVIPFLLAAKLSRLISRYKPANLTEGNLAATYSHDGMLNDFLI